MMNAYRKARFAYNGEPLPTSPWKGEGFGFSSFQGDALYSPPFQEGALYSPPSQEGTLYSPPFQGGAGGGSGGNNPSQPSHHTGVTLAKRRAAHGFTLIEIILSILIVGISIPAIVTAFSSLKASKNPEFAVQAAFLAQKQLEKIADKKSSGSKTVSCVDIPATDGAYTFSCSLVDVTALDPDTDAGTPSFGKKMTLTVGRTDGEMPLMDFFALF